MGNYKSRPPHTCSEELLMRVLQSYDRLQQKLATDLSLPNVSALSPLQAACCTGDAAALQELLTTETAGERLENGLTLLHLCCLSYQPWPPAPTTPVLHSPLTTTTPPPIRSTAAPPPTIICDSTITSATTDSVPESVTSTNDVSATNSANIVNNNTGSCGSTLNAVKCSTVNCNNVPILPSTPTSVVGAVSSSSECTVPCVFQLSNTKPKERSKALKKNSKFPLNTATENTLKNEVHATTETESKKEKFSQGKTNNDKGSESPVEKRSPKPKKSVKTFENTDVSSNTYRGTTPSSDKNLVACVKMLLEKGADTAIISKNGFSPLHLAAYQGCSEVVQLLVDECPHLDHTAAGSLTALHVACLAGHLSVVRQLSQRGANIEARDQASYAPLHIAALLNHVAVVEYLVSRGVDVNISASVGTRALHLAAGGGHSSVVLVLLQRGARVCLQDEEGHLPLHWCVGRGLRCPGSSLTDGGAALANSSSDGRLKTGKWSRYSGGASTASSMEVLALLLHYHRRADVLVSNLYCDTPLHVACYNGRYECAKTLLTYGGPAQLLKENLWGETPLHASCSSGSSNELVTFLLQQHHNYLNYQSWDGHTPLHSACFHGHTITVQLLLSHSVDTSIATHTASYKSKDDPGGETAMCFAYERGHDEIVALLKQHQHRPAHTPLSPTSLLFSHSLDDPNTTTVGGANSPEAVYFPVPSPRGKLRAITHEKLDVLHLRTVLPPELHLSLADIELIENIGSGSFGKVFKGRYRAAVVAVKRYRTNVSYGKSDVEMFCREVSILGSLDSPYIVQFVGACLEDPSQFAIVTAYVEGGSLFSNLHEQRLPLDLTSRLNIALDVARGMLYLHTLPMPIIHRDLNSHNILLSLQLRARVADFGESRFVRNLIEENLTKQPGNLRWMAPEVFTQCTQYSIKADVFSFGLCLWELLTCQLPFAHLKPAAAAADMAYKHSRPPLEPVFPFSVSRLLDCAWHKVPDERPHFAEIIEELEGIRDSQLESTESESSSSIVAPRQHRLHYRQHQHTCCSADTQHSPLRYTSPDRMPIDDELTDHVTALRSRWEQEASRGQSAFRSSQAASDDPGSVGDFSELNGGEQPYDDVNNSCATHSADTYSGGGDPSGGLPSMTVSTSNSCTSVNSALQPRLSSLLDDLRSRVNPNGYVEGSTYQYRVSSVLCSPSSTSSAKQ